jgi:hypothetical protein
MDRTERLLENVAAISADMHIGSDGRADRFYQRFGQELGGFPGIWSFCVEMGKAFTAAEDTHEAGDDWIDAILGFCKVVIEIDTLPTNKELVALAVKAITEANERN